MSELKVSGIKVVSAEYSFLNDPAAGAVGNVRLGVYVPAFSWIVGFWVAELTPITGAGGMTMSFGTIVNPATVVVNNLMVATAFASFTAQPLRGVDLDATPLKILTDVEIIMAIGTAALTAGQLQANIAYIENVL